MRSPLVIAGMFLAACAEPAFAADFHLFRPDSDQAILVDFDAVRAPSVAERTVPFYGVWRRPVHGLTGYGLIEEMVYRYDCAKRTMRADTAIIYDPEFKIIAQIPTPSPWRSITNELHVAEDFRRFCSAEPRAGNIGERLAANTLQQATVLARKRLKWAAP